MRGSFSNRDSSLVRVDQSATKAVMFQRIRVRIIVFECWQQIEAEDSGLHASLGSASYPRMSCLPSSHDSLPPDPSGEDAGSRGILDLS